MNPRYISSQAFRKELAQISSAIDDLDSLQMENEKYKKIAMHLVTNFNNINPNEKNILIELLDISNIPHFFSKAELKKIALDLLLQAIRTNNKDAFQFLLDKFAFTSEDINGYIIRDFAVLGARLINIALTKEPNGQYFIESLVKLGADINLTDHFGNTCLHYAALANRQDNIKFCENINPAWKNQTNCYGHIYEKCRKQNLENLQRINMNIILEKFDSYLTLSGRDPAVLEKLREGLCNGFTFIQALAILRGKIEKDIYFAMLDEIARWPHDNDQLNLQQLSAPISNPLLVDEFNTKGELFEYLLSTTLYFYNQKQHRVLETSSHDRAPVLSFINPREDRVESYFDILIEGYDLTEIKNILYENLQKPNTYIDLSINNVGESGHNYGFVTDNDGNIYYVDSNLSYETKPLSLADLDRYLHINYDTNEPNPWRTPLLRIECYEYLKGPEQNIGRGISEEIAYKNVNISEDLLMQAAQQDCRHLFKFLAKKVGIEKINNSYLNFQIHEGKSMRVASTYLGLFSNTNDTKLTLDEKIINRHDIYQGYEHSLKPKSET